VENFWLVSMKIKPFMCPLRLGPVCSSFADSRANHIGIFRDSGLDVKQYRYYDKKNISLDLEGMVDDIKVWPAESVSNVRPPLRTQLFCCMPVPIIPLA